MFFDNSTSSENHESGFADSLSTSTSKNTSTPAEDYHINLPFRFQRPSTFDISHPLTSPFSTDEVHHTTPQVGYFSYQPAPSTFIDIPISPSESESSTTTSTSASSTISAFSPRTTVLASLCHPLLAERDYTSYYSRHRDPLSTSAQVAAATMSSRKAASLFSLQTAAAHQQSPTKLGGVKKHSSVSSASSSDSSASESDSRVARHSVDARSYRPKVEMMRCSRCAKCVETISRYSSDGLRRVSTDDASASGMVRWGHNLYYCDRCARMVGYK